MKKNSYKKGALTLELLIAFAILVINITAIVLLINGGQSIYIDSETNSEAISKAESLLDKTKSDAAIDFNLVNPSTTTETSGGLTYTKKVEVAQTGLFTKEVTSTISWLAEGGRTLSIILKTLITNPDAVDGGDTCSSVMSNPEGWKTPAYYTFDSIDFFPSDPNANGIEISDLDDM
jgi:hypothetical protein